MLPDKLSENLPDALSNNYDTWDKFSNYCDILDKLSNDYNLLDKLSNDYNLLDNLSNCPITPKQGYRKNTEMVWASIKYVSS